MWVVAGIIAAAGICAAIEIPSLAGFKKDRWVFFLLLLLGTAASIAAALKAPIPNPLDWIAAVFQPLGNRLQRFFE